MIRAPLIALAAALAAAPALANDTEAEIALGGLIFEANDQISMDSEDLFISAELVRVRYTYTNHSSAPITLLVAFPLPAVPLPGQEPDWIEAAYPDWEQTIGMETRVNGKVVGLMRLDIAKVAGVDVDKRLKELGWPARHWEDKGFAARLNALPDDEKYALTAEGLLAMDEDEPGKVRPFWSVETSYVRTQTFPPGVPITVEHRYTPMVGGTVASALDRDIRGEALDPDSEYITRYCVDEAFVRGYDRKRYNADGSRNDNVFPVENWIGYTLSPGANWRGPIKRFRLTVDKGYPDRLVSLCMDGIRKIGPTRFEVVKTNYEPSHDLNVLIVTLAPTEGGQ
ncbi:hypothetical protein FHS52_002432 [Erythromicrobium ramosum]|uniref:DUF4424 domain-containing protein n=1 Tax=Erythrobacter ramosus TaxID=35811 RepID=A0A6I4UIW3_9SPHN|nr:DUF4424 family protein [Erythrobacter ramosus]MBB3776463.1 hypothetical protein [Erythrobacter ramosus]MXP38458.1 DUF4424 domain-containing protein [Erythrobacter ramosus]